MPTVCSLKCPGTGPEGKKKSSGITSEAPRFQTALELKETAFKLNQSVSELKVSALKLNVTVLKLKETARELKN